MTIQGVSQIPIILMKTRVEDLLTKTPNYFPYVRKTFSTLFY